MTHVEVWGIFGLDTAYPETEALYSFACQVSLLIPQHSGLRAALLYQANGFF